MRLLMAFLFAVCWLTGDSIYNYQLIDIDGNIVNLSDYQHKKILFVNTASNSSYVNQYASLEQLHQQFKDSLLIIASPSNDFGNEPLDNDSIKNFVAANYNIHYMLCAKTEVAGDSIAPLYKWLTDSNFNHVFQNTVHGDFFKFLIDGDGNPIGLFSSSVDPMDTVIQNLIQNQ